ncbi:MAG TPA: site-2 protease family protein [Thermomicrobiales bacterium]|nr:site-2 protease family protein [Thermomicrobiales bacterium]
MGLLIIPILAFLIIVHELGHFFAARSVGVTVEEFGIGIPPRAKGWRWKGVLWSLNWIPFGGFVRVKGEDGSDTSEGSMNAVGPLQRGWFLIAGPMMNLLVAVILSIVIVGVQGKPTEISPLFIGTVVSGSPAEGAGWQPGDKIVAIDGQPVDAQSNLVAAINDHAGEQVAVTIQRGNDEIQTTVTPREHPPAGQGATGISFGDGRLSDVVIQHVDAGSPAANAGVQHGDKLLAINGTPIEAFAQAVGMMTAAQGTDVAMTVERDGQTMHLTVPVPAPSILVTNVNADTPASDAMLYAGDRITAIGGQPTTTGIAFQDALRASAGNDVELTYIRDGKEATTTLAVPSEAADEQTEPVSTLGMAAAPVRAFTSAGMNPVGTIKFDPVPAAEIVPEGWNQFWGIITGTVDMLRNMATEGVDPNQLTGPIGMGQLTSELLSEASTPMWVTLTQITILISISLGVLNLLPLPALDGGRLMFVIIEILRGGKRIAPEKEGLVHLAGMVLLLGLMFFVAFGDISRLVDGRSILP